MAMPRLAGSTLFIGWPSMRNSPPEMSSSPAIISQERGLAAARRADEDDEFALLEAQVDIPEHFDIAEGFGHVDSARHLP